MPDIAGKEKSLWLNTGRPGGKSKFTSKYLDAPIEPLYLFGFGLSYTSYAYDNLKAENGEKEVKISATVKNTGKRAGEEIVQCYMQDMTAKRVRPVKQLAAYQKITLAPDEEKEVAFCIPEEKLGYYDWNMNFVIDGRIYRFYVGGSSADCLQTEIIR